MLIYLYIVLIIIITLKLLTIIIKPSKQEEDLIVEKELGYPCSKRPLKCDPTVVGVCDGKCDGLFKYKCTKVKNPNIIGKDGVRKNVKNKGENTKNNTNKGENNKDINVGLFSLENDEEDEYYCLPELPDKTVCNTSNGGIPVWSGWGETESMGWKCLCMFPEYFGGPGCSINPGVCSVSGQNLMDFDYDKLGRRPLPSDCKLSKKNSEGKDIIPNAENIFDILTRDISDGTPIIVPKRLGEADKRIGNDNKFYKGYK